MCKVLTSSHWERPWRLGREAKRNLLLKSNMLHRSTKPLDLERLESGGPIWFVLVNPKFEAPTAEMRAVLPKMVPMASQIHNAAMGGSLVYPHHMWHVP